VTHKASPWLKLQLPPLDGATAAWILDLCGLLQRAIWLAYGDQIETHWQTTEPEQPVYGPAKPHPTRKR